MAKLAIMPSATIESDKRVAQHGLVRFLSMRVGIVALSPRRVCRTQKAICESTKPTMRPMARESDHPSASVSRVGLAATHT